MPSLFIRETLTGTEKSVHVQSALEVVFVDIGLGTVDDLHTICDLNDAVCTRFLLPVSIRHNESLVFDLDAQSSKAGIHMLDIVCTTQTFNDGRHHLVAHFLVQLLDLLAIIFAAGSLVVELGDHEAEGEIVQEEAGNANDEHPDPVRAFIRLHDAIEDRAQERAAEGTGPRDIHLANVSQQVGQTCIASVHHEQQGSCKQEAVLDGLRDTGKDRRDNGCDQQRLDLRLTLRLCAMVHGQSRTGQTKHGNKVSAYEQEALAKKEKWRRGTFQEMSELLNKDGQDTAGLTAGKANMELPPEPEKGKAPGSIRSSAEAYRNMNRSLGTVYTRNENQPNADLLRRIEDLEKERKPAEEQAEGQTLEEKMALLEKSYELAARYNGKEPDASSTTNAPNSRKERTAVRPVKRVQNRMVSSLAQPAGNEDIASGYAGERNTGFHTPVGKMPSSGRNTIAACVHGTQTVSDGQALRIRLLEPMAVDDLLIPKGTVLVGGTRVEGERMGILIETVEYRGTLFPVELEVYDADGQQGILVPNSMEYDAAREIAAGMGTSIGSSINISTDAGAQIASDVGKGVIRGVSQYVGKKMRTVKITLKAGHRLLLHSPEK